jgi:hypothetical protein
MSKPLLFYSFIAARLMGINIPRSVNAAQPIMIAAKSGTMPGLGQ